MKAMLTWRNGKDVVENKRTPLHFCNGVRLRYVRGGPKDHTTCRADPLRSAKFPL